MRKSESKACELPFTCTFQQKKCPIALFAESVTTPLFSQLQHPYIPISPYLFLDETCSVKSVNMTFQSVSTYLEETIGLQKTVLALELMLTIQKRGIQNDVS